MNNQANDANNAMSGKKPSMTMTMGKEPTPMSRRTPIIVTVSLIAAAVAWWAFRPELLFVDKTVNESFPQPTSLVSNQGAAASEGMAAGETLLSGMFRGVAHETKGTATVHRLADGRRVLRLTGFSTSNGPDVRVLLVAADDAADSDAVKKAGWVELAPLKGNLGDQNYDIPADLDLSTHRACTIWCNRFGVNFGTAALAAPMAGGMSDGMSDAMPADTKVSSGAFHGVAHETKGTATIHRLADGRRILRLSDFSTSNGPDVRVLLVMAKDAADSDAVKKAGFVEVAPLKGNVGDQNYELPKDLDLTKFGAVTIWCNRFSVNFATAPLS